MEAAGALVYPHLHTEACFFLPQGVLQHRTWINKACHRGSSSMLSLGPLFIVGVEIARSHALHQFAYPHARLDARG
ncbi:hypothetical protein GCM10009539_62610 [Cryptosporangium japonicum]|uniref:Uncharacterized protein n=1 Tax=Cryptosporangium japonicum TaxID=80872 RepID=A0ABN0UZJ0_9ACTN